MTITQSSTRLVALTLGVAAVVAVAFGAALATPAHAASVCPNAWSVNLKMGMTNSDVMKLQQYLNMDAATQVAASGAGSPGMESSYFGGKTKAAVMKFQTKNSIAPVAGFVGALTRAKLNSLCTGTAPTTPPSTTPSSTTGTSLMIAAGTQPANGLNPFNTSRVAYTNFTVTAGSDGDVTLNNVTVERQGAAADANFSGVILLDQNGLQVGTSKTLNSNHQAVIGETVVIPRGTSRTFTVAANRAGSGSHGGEVASFAVVAVSASATVSGSLPITGATNTINETLVVGSVSTTTSQFDPQVAQTKNIGDTGIKFSGIRFTAGSSEDLKLFSIRWRQVGSASSADLANLMTVVNGTSYPATMDATGKYFTTLFPGGITIVKGNSIDAYIKGDLIGSNSANRTVDFDIDKVTDVYFVGQLYGYGIAPSGTWNPWYDGYVVTIKGGTVTSIGKATEVPAQNIAVNVSNQPLGGFVTDFKGEAVSENSLTVLFSYSSGAASSNLLTGVSIVNQNGVAVAGPQDATAVSGTQQTVTFTDSVTFPTGRQVYTIKGKVPSGVSNNVTITASTTPSGWGTPTGQSTGNSVSITTGNFSMNSMTIKAASLAISMSATPASQTVIAGAQNLLFANVQLDASQSGEEIRVSSLPIRFTVAASAVVGDLTSCQLYDGTTVLNTGSNVPTVAASATKTTFSFDNSLTVPKGTVKSLMLKCNLSSSAVTSGTYIASVNSGDTFAALGASGVSVTVAVTTGNSGTMTAGASSLSVTTDPSSPGYTIGVAGGTGVTLGAYKFSATNDDVQLQRIGLSLGTVTASSSAADLTQVYLYNGATLLGTATFVGTSRTATSTLTTPVTITKNSSLTVTVKADLPTQNASSAAHPGALLTVDVDINGATGAKNTSAISVSGSTTVDPSGSTAVSGVRVFRTRPTFVKLTPASQTLIAQSGVEMYRFSVSADSAQDVAINNFNVNVATSSVSTTNGTTSVTNLKVFAYTDAALSNSVPGTYTNAQIVATLSTVASGNNTATLSSILTVPKGLTYYFKVTGDITQVAGTTGSAGTVTAKIMGDAAYPSLASNLLDTTSNIGTNNFVWSPMSTSTTAATANVDWTNGFNVPGLPSGGTDSWTLTK